jgi:ribosome-associated protein
MKDDPERDEGVDQPEAPSKSQVKRELQALRELGERLVEMPASQLARIPMSDTLAAAVAEGRRITSFAARKRQIGYIGKLLRSEEVEAMRQILADMDAGHRAEARRFQRLETWRDRMLAEGDEAVAAFLVEYPGAEAQPLRQLIRNARREADAGKPPASARKLFRYLREVTGG